MADIVVGSKVRTGVYVGGMWQPMSLGIVVAQSEDKSVSQVDVMSLHGGAPWVRYESTSQLRLETTAPPAQEKQNGAEAD